MVSCSWLVHAREAFSSFGPVELARVDDHTCDGSAMPTNPFGGRVDNDISTMVDGAAEITTSTERIVNLYNTLSLNALVSLVIKLTTTGTPAACATLAIASKSGTLYLGFPIVSM